MPWCTPGMGVNLWGESPLCVNPVNVFKSLAQILAEGKGGTVRDRPEEASGKAMSRRTETAYKPSLRVSQHHMTKPRIQEIG